MLTFDIGSSLSAGEVDLEENWFFTCSPFLLGRRQATLTPGDHATTDTFLQIYQVLKSAIFLSSFLPVYGGESLLQSRLLLDQYWVCHIFPGYFFYPFHKDCAFALHLRALQ